MQKPTPTTRAAVAYIEIAIAVARCLSAGDNLKEKYARKYACADKPPVIINDGHAPIINSAIGRWRPAAASARMPF